MEAKTTRGAVVVFKTYPNGVIQAIINGMTIRCNRWGKAKREEGIIGTFQGKGCMVTVARCVWDAVCAERDQKVAKAEEDKQREVKKMIRELGQRAVVLQYYDESVAVHSVSFAWVRPGTDEEKEQMCPEWRKSLFSQIGEADVIQIKRKHLVQEFFEGRQADGWLAYGDNGVFLLGEGEEERIREAIAREKTTEKEARDREKREISEAMAEFLVKVLRRGKSMGEEWDPYADVRVTDSKTGENKIFVCRNIFDVGFVVNRFDGDGLPIQQDGAWVWSTMEGTEPMTEFEVRAIQYLESFPPISKEVRM